MAEVNIKVATQQVGDPEITIFTIKMKSDSGVWDETYGSKELAEAYLDGVKAGFAMSGGGFVTVPPIE